MDNCGFNLLYKNPTDPERQEWFLENKSEQSWSSLHTHSGYSPDGLGRISSLVAHAKNMGFKHLAITDHGLLAGSVEFGKLCKANGIKPIFGNEIYVSHDSRNGMHLTVLAINDQGWSNLVMLNNIAYKSGHTSKFGIHSVDVSLLLKYHEGLLVTTGCPASPFHRMPYTDALILGRRFKATFGDRFFAELMFTSNEIGVTNHERTVQLAHDLNLKMIFSNDVHYVLKEHAKLHKEFKRVTNNSDYDSSWLYLADTEDLLHRVKAIDASLADVALEAMQNSYYVAEKIDNVNILHTPSIPELPNADNDLRELVWEAYSKYPEPTSEKEAELKRQLDVIIDNGYSSYHLITRDILDYARAGDIAIGKARGSAAGSFVSYLLGITDIDPFAHNLYFDRFLNAKRAAKSPPDIDSDISASGRETVLEYARKKYNSVQIAAWQYWHPKGLIRKLASHFGINQKTINEAAELFEGIVGLDDLDEIMNITKQEPIKTMFEDNSEMKQLFEIMLGQPSVLSKHAGGIAIMPENLDVPIIRTKDGVDVVAYGKNDLEDAGGVKFDFLGLSSLDVLEELEKQYGKPPSPLDYPDDSDEVKLLHAGDTLGVFQFKGKSIVDLAKAIKPRNVDEVAQISALARPAVLQSGLHQQFVQYRQNSMNGELNIREGSIEPIDNIEIVLDNGRKVILKDTDVIILKDGTRKFARDLEMGDEL